MSYLLVLSASPWLPGSSVACAVLFSAVTDSGSGEAPEHKDLEPHRLNSRRGGRTPGPALGQARTTVRGHPAEGEPGIWRSGVQAGPLQRQGHASCLPHPALSVPRDASLEKDCTVSLLGLRLVNVGFKLNKRLPDGCEVSTTC